MPLVSHSFAMSNYKRVQCRYSNVLITTEKTASPPREARASALSWKKCARPCFARRACGVTLKARFPVSSLQLFLQLFQRLLQRLGRFALLFEVLGRLQRL